MSVIHYSYIGLSLVSFISEEELRRDLTCPGPATLGSETLNLEYGWPVGPGPGLGGGARPGAEMGGAL